MGLILLALALCLLPVVWLTPDLAWTNQPPVTAVLSPLDQGALVLAVYAIKLVYMLLALAGLALTWGERGPAWLALQGSLAAFWLGEFFCAINILFFVEENLLFEYLHSVLMAFCLGLLFYAVMEALDEHVLHFSSPRARCALAGVCQNCVKAHPESPAACLLRRLFQLMIPLAAVVALMPLMVQPLDYAFQTTVFGLPRTLIHLMPVQWYELRFSPLAAVVLLAGSWLALVWRDGASGGLRVSKILLAAAVGQLGFSLMRLAFAAFYRERLVWFVFWEELTELLLILAIVVVVLLIRPERFSRLRAKVQALFQ